MWWLRTRNECVSRRKRGMEGGRVGFLRLGIYIAGERQRARFIKNRRSYTNISFSALMDGVYINRTELN